MFNAIVQGIGLGLLMCVLVGPVFFALMGVALHYSKRAAIWFAIGTALSDLIYAAIVFSTLGAVRLSHTVKWRMGLVGSLVFVIMGIVMIQRTLRHKKEEQAELELKKHPHPIQFLGQGFITNMLNPSVVIFRAGAVTASAVTLEKKYLIFVMIVTTLITFFSTDLIKVRLAEKIKNMLRKNVLFRLHIITGGLLIALGIGVLIKTIISHHF